MMHSRSECHRAGIVGWRLQAWAPGFIGKGFERMSGGRRLYPAISYDMAIGQPRRMLRKSIVVVKYGRTFPISDSVEPRILHLAIIR